MTPSASGDGRREPGRPFGGPGALTVQSLDLHLKAYSPAELLERVKAAVPMLATPAGTGG